MSACTVCFSPTQLMQFKEYLARAEELKAWLVCQAQQLTATPAAGADPRQFRHFLEQAEKTTAMLGRQPQPVNRRQQQPESAAPASGGGGGGLIGMLLLAAVVMVVKHRNRNILPSTSTSTTCS